jgi:hypothetical protein
MKKARKHDEPEVYWFELDLGDRAAKTRRNGSQPSIQIWGMLDVIEGLEHKILYELWRCYAKHYSTKSNTRTY